RGVFFSKVLDSGEKEMQWHRMTCEIPVLRTGIHFWLYCSDTEEVIYNGNKADIEEVLLSDIESEEKRRICQNFLKKEFLNETDVLLHDVKGRFIWLCVEIYAGQEENAAVDNIFIYFPRQ